MKTVFPDRRATSSERANPARSDPSAKRPHYPRLVIFCVLSFLWLAVVPLVGQSTDQLTAEQVEAGFIYNFTKYTEWPPLPGHDNTAFHLCVAGDGGVVEQLDKAVNGKAVGNRNIVVRHLDDSVDINDCELLYVGQISRKLDDRLTALLPGQPILTIGSTPGYLRGGGMITFFVEANRVRFDINARLAEKVNIRFDSRILALARAKE